MHESSPDYGVAAQTGVMVPMRDGVRLATDIYFPTLAGKRLSEPIPTLLERTPYDKTLAAARLGAAQYFASRRYAIVYQDVRGRFASEGKFTKYLNEPEDGFDTLKWIGEQSWSNGKVGTFGISYGAHTQAALAALAPPNLACCFMDSGGFTNAFDNSCRLGGAFELRQVVWAYTNALSSPEANANPAIRAALEAENLREWFRRMPWKRGISPLRWVPEFEDYLFDMWTRSDFDDYWKQPGICNELLFDQYADVPMIHMGSWYDPYTRTTTDNYTGLSALKRGPVHMILGPWTHGAHDTRFAGDVDFGSASVVADNLADDYNHLRLLWFDRWLKDIDTGADRNPPVRVFVMGGGDGRRDADGRLRHGGRWQNFDDWPPPQMRDTRFYFHPNGVLDEHAPAPDDAPISFDFDPKHPVPTVGGNISSGGDLIIGGAFDQREGSRFYGSDSESTPLSSKHDVLVFQTDALTSPVEIVGPVRVRLWASSSARDTDFTAKLVDVHPPSEDFPQGFDMNLTDGILRARYRNGFERQELMEPASVYEFVIELYPTANLFGIGHRIRVDISSSNFPRLDVNPNTGEPLGSNRRSLIAVNTVYMDEGRPSNIVLPVLEKRA